MDRTEREIFGDDVSSDALDASTVGEDDFELHASTMGEHVSELNAPTVGVSELDVSTADQDFSEVSTIGDLTESFDRALRMDQSATTPKPSIEKRCYYELSLEDALGDATKLPAQGPQSVIKALANHEVESVQRCTWDEWLKRRADACLLRAELNRQESKSFQCLVLYAHPRSKSGYVLFEVLPGKWCVNAVLLEKLRPSKKQVWNECRFACGGIHARQDPCPEKSKLIVKDQRERLASEPKKLLPEIPCPFGYCADLYHGLNDRCVQIEAVHHELEAQINARILREASSKRPSPIRILSWNTQKTFLTEKNATFGRRGFTEFEKLKKVGLPGAKRTFLPSERKLFELLIERFKAELAELRPDALMFQEFGPEDETNVNNFLARLGLSVSDGFAHRLFVVEIKQDVKADADADGADPDGDVLEGLVEEKTKKREQHLFVWRKSTMRESKHPFDYFKTFKHGTPSFALTHLPSKRTLVLTSLHLKCGSKKAPDGNGFLAAREEFQRLLTSYFANPKPVQMVNEAWTLDYERRRIKDGSMLHILGGDLNLNPHQLPGNLRTEIERQGWHATGSRYTVTNAAKEECGYDFFLVEESMLRFVSPCQRVLRSMTTKRAGHMGLSDHDPILLELVFTHAS